MSNDELREAIALQLGWLRPDHPDCMKFKQGWTIPEAWWMSPDGVLKFHHDIPAYETSLDACAQLRASLTEEDRVKYRWALADIVTKPGDMGWGVIDASAADHCHAFLAVRGTPPATHTESLADGLTAYDAPSDFNED